MRVLLSTTAGAGHFLPLVPVARALSAAGHELACAAPAEARAMVEKQGLRHVPFGGVPGDNEERAAVFTKLPELSHVEAEHLVASEIFGRLNTTYALPGAEAAVRDFAPDLVVHETAELAVALSAEQAGVRTVSVNPCLSLPVYLRAVVEGSAGSRAALGLAPDDGWLLRNGIVSWFPAGFDLPDLPGSKVLRFREPSIAAPTPLAQRDLVYVTLGSEAPHLPFYAAALRACVTGALAAGLKVVVAAGGPLRDDVLAGLEGDLVVHEWVDPTEVIPRARVVVCHAGAGTTLGALRAGVPVVAVPLFADQPHNAARLAATGTGVQVAPGPELADGVAEATRRLAESEPDASLEVAAQIAALPPIDDALPWLEG